MTELFGQKISFHRQLSDLGVELLELVLGIVLPPRTPLKQVLGVVDQLTAPVLDLIRMHLVLLGEFRQGLVAPGCRRGDLQLILTS